MEQVDEIEVPGWLTLNQAATRLGVTRQAVGQIAMRLGWRRGRLDKMVLVPALAVELYAASRRQRTA